MKFFFIIILIGVYGCNKSKTVFICGDHVCINKAEAQQYFEDNLSLEVQIIDIKKKNKTNLVELNLRSDSSGKKKINLLNKDNQNKKLKFLSKSEIKQTKAKLKKRNKINKIETELKKQTKKTKKIDQIVLIDKNKTEINKIEPKVVQKKPSNLLIKKNIIGKQSKKVVDICAILQECSIEEISKYLIKKSKGEEFPDITVKE